MTNPGRPRASSQVPASSASMQHCRRLGHLLDLAAAVVCTEAGVKAGEARRDGHRWEAVRRGLGLPPTRGISSTD